MPSADRPTDSERRAELGGGALAGGLDAGEERELARLLRDDPAAAAELDDLHATARLLRAHSAPGPGAQLRDRVLVAAGEAPVVRDGRRRWVAAAAAAVVLLAGGVLAGRLTAPDPAPTAVSNPPGTLGAREQLQLQPASAVSGAVAVVAHTWGTEAVLDVGGLPAGVVYRVALVSERGEQVDAGSFLATAGTVHCRLNVALLRRDAQRLTVSGPGGALVVTAALPTVS